MGVKYLWDTNTVIYYLQQQFPPAAEQFIDESLKASLPIISVITEIELLCWTTPVESDRKLLNDFIHDSLVIELEQPIKFKTAEIRQKHRIKLPDAIIAATALANHLTLITRNAKDFDSIDGLALVNPFDL
jgi:predicted nucleic acid-binding protein